MATKEHLHRLVEELPESELSAAERYLEYLAMARRDPFLQALLRASLDDEEESEDERVALAKSRVALEHRNVISDEELRRDLGL